MRERKALLNTRPRSAAEPVPRGRLADEVLDGIDEGGDRKVIDEQPRLAVNYDILHAADIESYDSDTARRSFEQCLAKSLLSGSAHEYIGSVVNERHQSLVRHKAE